MDLKAEYEAKLAEREQKRTQGKPFRGRQPKPPSETPPSNAHHNFADPESRIMKAGNGNHFDQAMGFRRFSLRDLDDVSTEWTLVCLNDNLKRLFNLNNKAYSPDFPYIALLKPRWGHSAHPSLLKHPIAAVLRSFVHFISAIKDHDRIVLSPTGC